MCKNLIYSVNQNKFLRVQRKIFAVSKNLLFSYNFCISLLPARLAIEAPPSPSLPVAGLPASLSGNGEGREIGGVAWRWYREKVPRSPSGSNTKGYFLVV